MNFETYHQYIEAYAPVRGLTFESKDSAQLGASMVLSHQPKGDHSDPALPAWSFVGVVAGVCRCSAKYDGPRKDFALHPNIAAALPPGVRTEIYVNGSHSVWVLPLADGEVRRGLALPATEKIDLGRLQEPGVESRLVSALARSIWECLGDPTANPLHVETLVDALVVAAYRDGHKAEPAALRKASTAKRDFTQLIAYVNDNIAMPLTLADLSEVARATSAELTRAFKAQMGLPLHQYVLQARVSRARDLLKDQNLSLAEIAYAAGFSSQAHMTSTFTRMIGTTPGRLRRVTQ
jgi:AraC family transcriptional regulator